MLSWRLPTRNLMPFVTVLSRKEYLARHPIKEKEGSLPWLINCQYNSKPICICLKNSLSLHQRRVCYGSPFFVSWFSWKPDKHGDSPQQASFWLLICVKSRCNLRQNARWFEADDTTIRPRLQAENTSFLKLRKNRTICISTEQSFLLQFFTIFIRVLSCCSFGWES